MRRNKGVESKVVKDVKVEEVEESGVGEKKLYKLLWAGSIGCRKVDICVYNEGYRIRVDVGDKGKERSYYFSTLEGGLSYIAKEIVRINMKDNARGPYRGLGELLEAVRSEYYKIRLDIEKALGEAKA